MRAAAASKPITFLVSKSALVVSLARYALFRLQLLVNLLPF
jgi:hypothetical protein